MKRFTFNGVWVFLAALAFTLTSCEDEDIARTLEGTWEGNMYVSTYFDYNDRYYDATYSEVCFVRDPYRYASGDGYWVDYYNDSYWGRNYLANHIYWEVNNGNIRVHFKEENSDVVIYNYSLDNSYFTGYIELYNGGRQRFQLRHISSPNWNSYYWGYDDRYFYGNGTTFDKQKVKGKQPVEQPMEAPKRIFRARE